MLFLVTGLPSAFAEWCDALVMRLAGQALGPIELIHADTLKDIALNIIETGASQAVVSSRQPGGRLRAALVERGRNFIVALDDPGLVLADLVLGRGVALAAATRAVASSCAALANYRSAPGALVLDGAGDWPQPAATAAAIARHLEIAVDEREIAELIADLPAGDSERSRRDAFAWWNGLAAAEREMASGALLPYIEHQEDGQPPSVTWVHALFFVGDRPDECATGPIDITGRARCLLCGPRIMLPPGCWSLVLTMALARGAAEHEFLVEICSDRPLSAGTIRPRQEGSAELAVDFVLDDATEHPIDIRVSSLRAAFDGAIALVGATLVRAAPATADTPQAGPAAGK